MKRNIKRFFLFGFGLFLLMQFYQPARNTDGGQVLPVHITRVLNVPANVQTILQTSCYDCHSNNTNYPWYSYLQPSRMLMEWDIRNGKKDLNFSEFGNYSKRKQENKLSSIIKRIEKEEMPLPIYTMIHKDAILSISQKEEIKNWINNVLKETE